MYILDEVDSALDLSHTQNIGQLIRTRFKGSQFIIVSLKDGMFNNANVLFKTKFRDGVSTVEVSFMILRVGGKRRRLNFCNVIANCTARKGERRRGIYGA